MKKFIECFVTFLALSCFACGAQAQEVNRSIRVIIFGDSLTSGYQLQPQQSFAAKLDRKFKANGYGNIEVVNMSVAGETSAGGLERLNTLLGQYPDVVVLELGGNDILRGISANLIFSNIGSISQSLSKRNVYTIIVGMRAPASMGSKYVAEIDRIYNQLANGVRPRLPFYPFALEGIIGREDLSMADGYHPNAKGVEVMVERLYPMIDTGVRWKYETLRYMQQYQNPDMPAEYNLPAAPPSVGPSSSTAPVSPELADPTAERPPAPATF